MKRILALCCALATTPAQADLFTEYAQAKPILEMIKRDWVGIGASDGQDLLYFTLLLSYRCAIQEIRFSYNNGPLTTWDAEPCYWDERHPNAIKMETHLPYAVAPLGSLNTITIDLLFEDGTTMTNTYDRTEILLP